MTSTPHIISYFILFIIILQLIVATPTPTHGYTFTGAGEDSGNLIQKGSDDALQVYVSPPNPSSQEPSFVLVRSRVRPTVKVNLIIDIRIHSFQDIEKEIVAHYTMEGLPVAWAPDWYLVPVPGLPAAKTDHVSIRSRVEYTVYLEGVLAYSGSYNVSGQEYKGNLAPFIYAFVEDVFNDPGTVNETLGLSPSGWSVGENNPEKIYVIAIDDRGLSSVNGEYRVADGQWRSLTLTNSSLLQPVEDAVQQLNKEILKISPGLEEFLPSLPVELLETTIPGQPAGTTVEFRASATDVNDTTSYSLHGFYYVDKEGGRRVLIIDPWVFIWTVARVTRDYLPVVAVDLAHGENDNGLEALISNITFVKWKIITGKITPDELKDVDILVIGQPTKALTVDEANTIRSWLARGHKALWVSGDSDYGQTGPIVQENCNTLLQDLNSHLRLETGDVIDEENNIGGKAYRVLAKVEPDVKPSMLTQILTAGIEYSVLFHGPTAVIWLDDNNIPHDPVKDAPPGLTRIVYTYNTASILDNNPPQLILYGSNTSKSRKFVLMAAEKLQSGSIIIASGETPYGGFVPISTSEYMGVRLDGFRLVYNTILWASLEVMRGKYMKSLASYDFPSSAYKGMGLPAVEASMLNIARFHHWQSIASNSDIYIATPSGRVFKLLKPKREGGFEPRVIILSNLGLGLNLSAGAYSSFYDWDLKDIVSPRYGSLLETIIDYVKSHNAGLIATHSTLSDLMVWYSCGERMKIGSRGHVGYSLADVNIDDESTVAAMLGIPQLALWEAARDTIAYSLCKEGESAGATPVGMALYATGLAIGSTPLQLPYIPWRGDLHITREGRSLGWNLPDEFNITIPSIYKDYGYNAYTEVGWQLAMPQSIMYPLSEKIRDRGKQVSIVYSYLSAISRSQRLIDRQISGEIENETLRALYNIITNSTFTDNGFTTQIDLGEFNDTLRNQKYHLHITVGSIMEALLKIMPLKLLAVSQNGEAAILAYDKYWARDGYRSVYFSFEVEASPDNISQVLINRAVEWVSNWKFVEPLDYINGKLPVNRETKETYESLLASVRGPTVVSREAVLPDGGEARLSVELESGKLYAIIVVHPTSGKISISSNNLEILKKNTTNNVTYALVKPNVNSVTLSISPDSKLSLNPTLITIKTYKTTQTTTPPITSPTTKTTTASKTTTTTRTQPKTTPQTKTNTSQYTTGTTAKTATPTKKHTITTTLTKITGKTHHILKTPTRMLLLAALTISAFIIISIIKR